MTNEGEKLNIICLSNQQWDYSLWTNKKHVMFRLSKQGHNVVFVDPPISTGRLLLRQFLAGKWSFKRLLTQQYSENNTKIVSPLNWVPLYDLLGKLHVKLIKCATKKLFSNDRKTVLWVYHVETPGIKYYLKLLKYDLLIYDCVDNYAAFPKHNTSAKREWVVNQESYLAKKADIIFATAPGLVEKMKKYNSNVHFTPNVGDYEKFQGVSKNKFKVPEDLENIPRPRIGFVGAVDEYKFDGELIKKTAEDHPDFSFVIIGPIAAKDREASLEELGLKGLRNVYFLGSRDYSGIQNYYAGFDAYMIPFQLNDYTVGGCFPVKFHEALAAGVPTVVTNLPAYKPFDNVAYISKNAAEFSNNIKKALDENNENRVKARLEVAKQNNWEGKVVTLLNLIFSELSKK